MLSNDARTHQWESAWTIFLNGRLLYHARKENSQHIQVDSLSCHGHSGPNFRWGSTFPVKVNRSCKADTIGWNSVALNWHSLIDLNRAVLVTPAVNLALYRWTQWRKPGRGEVGRRGSAAAVRTGHLQSTCVDSKMAMLCVICCTNWRLWVIFLPLGCVTSDSGANVVYAGHRCHWKTRKVGK